MIKKHQDSGKVYSGKSIAQQLLQNTKLGKLLWGDNTYTDGYGTTRTDAPLKESANGQELQRMEETAKDAAKLTATGLAFANPVTASNVMAPLIAGSQAYWIGTGFKDGVERTHIMLEDPSQRTAQNAVMLGLDFMPAPTVAKQTMSGAKEVVPALKSVGKTLSKPEVRMETVRFSKNPIDTSDPTQRQALIKAYQDKYPSFNLGTEKEIIVGGDGYYEIGKFPYSSKTMYQKNWMKNRLDDLVPDWRNEFGYYWFPENHSANMARGETILNNAGSNGVRVVIPKTQSGYHGGFYMASGSNAGDSFIIANPYRTKPAEYTVIHESLSHPTDDFVLSLKPNGSNKTIQQLYEEISKPEDLFPDYKSVMRHNASQKAYEARAVNNEMVYRLIKNVVPKNNITWSNAANNPEHVRNFINTRLSDDSELARFLESMDNAYAQDYASLLRKYAGTEQAHTYANRIRNMMSYLPAIFGLSAGAYHLNNQSAYEKTRGQ